MKAQSVHVSKCDLLTTEFHCHTMYSNDSLTEPRKLVETCRRKGIDRVVVTDHNTIEGALRCKELSPNNVIVGEEIMTIHGEILAAFVKKAIPSGLHPLDAIACLQEQRAFISISHPFDIHRSGHWKENNLLKIISHIDAIETFNSRCFLHRYNLRARTFARKHALLETYGSDAHAAFELGRGTLLVPDFYDATSLKKALKYAQIPPTRKGSLLVHSTSRFAAVVNKIRKNVC